MRVGISVGPWLLMVLAPTLSGAGTTPKTETPASTPASYAVTTRWAVEGDSGWDYLTFDEPRHRLFVAHGERVDVIDVDSGTTVGRISPTAGVHGIALAPNLQRGYTSNGRANSVTAFDLTAMRAIQETKVSGLNPDAIYYDEPTEHVFTFNGKSANATVLDAHTLAILRTIPLAGKPEFVAADGRGHLYVNIETNPGQIQVIDTRNLMVVATWKLPGCANPSGLAIDAGHRRLFSACDNGRMVVTNADTGRRVATSRIGADPDAVAFDEERGLVFVSSGATGTLNVIRVVDADHVLRLADVKTQVSARTMALDPATHRIYLAAASYQPSPHCAADPQPRIVQDSFGILVAEPQRPASTEAPESAHSHPKL